MFQFQYRDSQDVPSCPGCRQALPTGSDSAQAYRLRVRKNGRKFEGVRRFCHCGQEFAIDKSETDRWGYSYHCQRCSEFLPELPFGGRCTRCHLQDVVGVRDPLTLVAGLREAEPYLPPSRQDLLDGLLHGLLTGAPGLTLDDAA